MRRALDQGSAAFALAVGLADCADRPIVLCGRCGLPACQKQHTKSAPSDSITFILTPASKAARLHLGREEAMRYTVMAMGWDDAWDDLRHATFRRFADRIGAPTIERCMGNFDVSWYTSDDPTLRPVGALLRARFGR